MKTIIAYEVSSSILFIFITGRSIQYLLTFFMQLDARQHSRTHRNNIFHFQGILATLVKNTCTKAMAVQL